jgi:hypothetical protein
MKLQQDKKVYVTIPGKGDHELSSLLDTISFLKPLAWTHKVWTPTPALIDKTSGSSRQYVGQKFDAKYFDLVPDGWTHDHCEICYETISNKEGYGDNEGYEADNGDWICNDCYNLFIKGGDINETIKSFKTITK